jgi:phage tail tape-measure protein
MLQGIKDDIIDRLKNRTAITIAVGKLGILVAHDLALYGLGEIDREKLRARLGGHVGSSAGIVLGAAVGAAVGAVVPGIGNIAGAFTGGIVGAMGGEELGRATASLLEPHLPRIENDPPPDQTGH